MQWSSDFWKVISLFRFQIFFSCVRRILLYSYYFVIPWKCYQNSHKEIFESILDRCLENCSEHQACFKQCKRKFLNRGFLQGSVCAERTLISKIWVPVDSGFQANWAGVSPSSRSEPKKNNFLCRPVGSYFNWWITVCFKFNIKNLLYYKLKIFSWLTFIAVHNFLLSNYKTIFQNVYVTIHRLCHTVCDKGCTNRLIWVAVIWQIKVSLFYMIIPFEANYKKDYYFLAFISESSLRNINPS